MEAESSPLPATVDAYIASFSPDVQRILGTVRDAIRDAAPDAEECIRYGIPTFRFHGNLVHFAAYRNHIGFYPTPSAIAAFRTELLRYKQAKGSVQFPLNEPIPVDLIRRIVRFRVKEHAAKAIRG